MHKMGTIQSFMQKVVRDRVGRVSSTDAEPVWTVDWVVGQPILGEGRGPQ